MNTTLVFANTTVLAPMLLSPAYAAELNINVIGIKSSKESALLA